MCQRGASALQDILDSNRDSTLRVFVVWEPVIATDVAPPSDGTLARITDPRVIQMWDERRRISEVLAAGLALEGGDSLVARRGVVWDVAAGYPRGARWTGSFASATFAGGPVAAVADRVR